jgi:hypothetical protein
MRSDALLPIIVALTAGCADFKRGAYWEQDADTGAAETADDGALGYAGDVHPLLDAGCERCHAAGNSASNTKFLLVADDPTASYAVVLEFVDLEQPEQSRLLSKGAGVGHGGAVIFDDSSSEYDTILAWIEQGAMP